MPKKILKNLADVFSDVAARKSRAAKARRTPPGEGETPRQVFQTACAQLGAALEDYGFRYAKSGPHATRHVDQFSHKIYFSSSHYNVRGEHVALELAAGVFSRALKQWRNKQTKPYRKGDRVAGGAIHLLGTEFAYLRWDLADPDSRQETVDDALSAIHSIVLPYFDLFVDPAETARSSSEKAIPEFGLADSVEFALCFGSREQALAILERFFDARPDLKEPAAEALERFESKGLPDRIVSSYAEQAAWVRLAYGLMG